jgi:aspartate carbamoyltransferase catalytic subunit
MVKHVIFIKQFLQDKATLQAILDDAAQLEAGTISKPQEILSNKIVATLFYEPSTRTRLSFESAAQRLGAGIISTENAGEFSSASKGETLEDTIRTVSGYADAIVLRHPEIGSAERASKVSSVPVINAGDGSGEHPTQALLDLSTITQAKKSVDGLKIGLVGDLRNGRTVHSLIQLLSLYDVTIFLIAPPQLRLPEKYKKLLMKATVSIVESEDLAAVLPELDVIYMTRVQKERFGDKDEFERLKNAFILTPELMKDAKADAIVMHPLPRNAEISPEFDKDPRALYFTQAHHGLYVRMALLKHLLT